MVATGEWYMRHHSPIGCARTCGTSDAQATSAHSPRVRCSPKLKLTYSSVQLSTQEGRRHLVGTPSYMAPEVLERAAVREVQQIQTRAVQHKALKPHAVEKVEHTQARACQLWRHQGLAVGEVEMLKASRTRARRNSFQHRVGGSYALLQLDRCKDSRI